MIKMMMNNWNRILTIIGIFAFLLLVLVYTGGNSSTNLYSIPSEVFGIFMASNTSIEQQQTENHIQEEDHFLGKQKRIDSFYTVEEQNTGLLNTITQKKSIILVTDKDLHVFPELERTLHEKDHKSGTADSRTAKITTFNGNTSEFFDFINSVCKKKARSECYNDVAVFEYDGRYYSIDMIVFDTTRVI